MGGKSGGRKIWWEDDLVGRKIWWEEKVVGGRFGGMVRCWKGEMMGGHGKYNFITYNHNSSAHWY